MISKMTFYSTTLTLTLSLSGTISFADTTNDHSIEGMPKILVKYDDLSLEKNEDVSVLYSRLRSAANRACGKSFNRLTLARKIQEKKCIKESLERAVASINNRDLHQLYATTK